MMGQSSETGLLFDLRAQTRRSYVSTVSPLQLHTLTLTLTHHLKRKKLLQLAVLAHLSQYLTFNLSAIVVVVVVVLINLKL